MKRNKMLNVRAYIEWVILITEMHQKYGVCPALDYEMPKLRLVGRAILRKHDTLRKKGNRKDLYVEARP